LVWTVDKAFTESLEDRRNGERRIQNLIEGLVMGLSAVSASRKDSHPFDKDQPARWACDSSSADQMKGSFLEAERWNSRRFLKGG
jgi:hypothetical protein